MKSSASLIFAAATIAFLSTTVNADSGPDYQVTLNDTYIGCFKSSGDLKASSAKENFQSTGLCRGKCSGLGTKYSGLTKKFFCYCGNTLPPESDQVSNDACNLSCAGYPQDPCGSNTGDFTIFLTDPNEIDNRLYNPNKPLPSSGSSTSSSSSATSTSTLQGTSTTSPTPTGTSDTPIKSEPSGINKAGAAAGAVVGVLVAIAIGVGAFLFIRKQRRKKLEEEYRRSLAIREFHKKPEADLRLDPVMLQRRMSDGSIADNQDYSRRILKVTNPDGM